MEVSRCLWELLFYHECVIIPGFGGFITRYQPAGINETTHVFSPARRLLSFQPGLTHHDGLLTLRFAQQAGISYPEAKEAVSRFAGELRDRLAKQERVELTGIGVFSLDEEKNLQFDPHSSANFHLESFGLPVFSFSPASTSGSQRSLSPGRPAFAGRVSSRRHISWLAGIPLALLFSLIVPPSTHNPMEEASIISSLSKGVMKPKAPTQEVPVKIVTPPINSLPVQTQQNPAAAGSVPSELPQSAMAFHIIGGSMPSMEGAEVIAKQYRSRGYSVTIVPSGTHRFRVSLFSSSSYSETLSQLQVIRKNEGNPHIWLLRN